MRFELSRGMMFLIRPTDVHGYEIEPGEEISVCTVRFTSVMLDRNIVSALADSSVSRRTISERSSAIA